MDGKKRNLFCSAHKGGFDSPPSAVRPALRRVPRAPTPYSPQRHPDAHLVTTSISTSISHQRNKAELPSSVVSALFISSPAFCIAPHQNAPLHQISPLNLSLPLTPHLQFSAISTNTISPPDSIPLPYWPHPPRSPAFIPTSCDSERERERMCFSDWGWELGWIGLKNTPVHAENAQ